MHNWYAFLIIYLHVGKVYGAGPQCIWVLTHFVVRPARCPTLASGQHTVGADHEHSARIPEVLCPRGVYRKRSEYYIMYSWLWSQWYVIWHVIDRVYVWCCWSDYILSSEPCFRDFLLTSAQPPNNVPPDTLLCHKIGPLQGGGYIIR